MVNIKDVTDGNMNGQTVWICDLRYNNYNEKPIRNIKPTKVLIRDNNETNKKIYYSSSHFVGLNKKNQPIKSKVIAVYDNTGYRSITGTPLNCFLSENECVQYYKKQLEIAIKGLKYYKASMIIEVDEKISKLEKEFQCII